MVNQCVNQIDYSSLRKFYTIINSDNKHVFYEVKDENTESIIFIFDKNENEDKIIRIIKNLSKLRLISEQVFIRKTKMSDYIKRSYDIEDTLITKDSLFFRDDLNPSEKNKKKKEILDSLSDESKKELIDYCKYYNDLVINSKAFSDEDMNIEEHSLLLNVLFIDYICELSDKNEMSYFSNLFKDFFDFKYSIVFMLMTRGFNINYLSEKFRDDYCEHYGNEVINDVLKHLKKTKSQMLNIYTIKGVSNDKDENTLDLVINLEKIRFFIKDKRNCFNIVLDENNLSFDLKVFEIIFDYSYEEMLMFFEEFLDCKLFVSLDKEELVVIDKKEKKTIDKTIIMKNSLEMLINELSNNEYKDESSFNLKNLINEVVLTNTLKEKKERKNKLKI